MKYIFLVICFSIFCLIANGQNRKLVTGSNANAIFEILSGQYARCEVTMGMVKGTGGIIFGNPSRSSYGAVNDFSFNIYVLQSQDKQFGKMKNIQVETSDYNSFNFFIQWNNNRTDQGTLSAEIQLFYSFTKKRYETYFVNNSSSVFNIFWWTELDTSQNGRLKRVLNSVFQNEIAKRDNELNKKKHIEDSIQFKKMEVLRVQDSIFKMNLKKTDSINKLKIIEGQEKKRKNDSMLLQKEIDKLNEIKNLAIGSDYLGGYIVYKSSDSLHGLVISKTEVQVSFLDLFHNSINLNDPDALYAYNHLREKRLEHYHLDKYLDQKILAQKLFPNEMGFTLPTLEQIRWIRESYNTNEIVKLLLQESQNNNVKYPWVYHKNNIWYFINAISSNSSFNFGIKNEMKYTRYLYSDYLTPKDLAIVRLVKEF